MDNGSSMVLLGIQLYFRLYETPCEMNASHCHKGARSERSQNLSYKKM